VVGDRLVSAGLESLLLEDGVDCLFVGVIEVVGEELDVIADVVDL
jgi:hypothetical protein